MVPPAATASTASSGAATAAALGSPEAPAIKDPATDTSLTPRFYTTDFEAMAAMEVMMTGGEYEYQLDLAKIENGKHTAWVELANRKFRKQLTRTKHFPKEQAK